MALRGWLSRAAVSLGTLACIGGPLLAQAPQNPSRNDREQLPRPIYRVAQQTGGTPAVAANTNPLPTQPHQGDLQAHPLVPAMQMAYEGLNHIRNDIKDYSATMIKHERVQGKLNDPEYMFIKVRHEPFSVYMYFLGPDRLKGQEVLFVEGKNNGNLLGHGVGIKKIAGTVPLLPTGAMAMAGQRYPITEIGISMLTKRLVEVGEQDMKYGECDVKFFRGAKINVGNVKRSVTGIEVVHPVPRKNFRFHIARIFVDDELKIPVRYESYDWPEKPGGPPQLLEEYTYTDIKLNNGFTDTDFDENNPNYHFH
jgi:hypothetical protein